MSNEPKKGLIIFIFVAGVILGAMIAKMLIWV
jgi:hypothetical protein